MIIYKKYVYIYDIFTLCQIYIIYLCMIYDILCVLP